MEYLISVIISLFVFFYYTFAMGLYSKRIKYNWWNKTFLFLVFITVFIPYFNFVFFGFLLFITLILALIHLYKTIKKL